MVPKIVENPLPLMRPLGTAGPNGAKMARSTTFATILQSHPQNVSTTFDACLERTNSNPRSYSRINIVWLTQSSKTTFR